jgi:hypothetical protein
VSRETPDVDSYMSSRMPGMSGGLLPKRDVWGRPITSEGGVGPDIISPIWTSTEKQDPVTAALLADNLKVGKPGRKVGGRKLSDVEYDRYQSIAGPLMHDRIAELLVSPSWRDLDEEGKQRAVSKATDASREIARALVGIGKGAGKGKAPPMPPAFEAMPAIPEGFELIR